MRGLPRLLLLLGAAILVAPLPAQLPAQSRVNAGQERLLGTWRLDLSMSKYSPGPPLRSETRVYTRDAQGVKGTIDRVYSDGRREVIEYRAEVDIDVPVSGSKAYDAIRFKRVDELTTEGVLSHAGRVFGSSRRVIAEDGQTMTITFRREEPGDMVNNFAVYRRSP
jgi:hypothetical protein